MKKIKYLIIILLAIIVFPVNAAFDYESLSNNPDYDSNEVYTLFYIKLSS